jgi:hypothetical protein
MLPEAGAGEEGRTSAAEAGSLVAAIGTSELVPFPVPPESDVEPRAGGVSWRSGRPVPEAGEDARRARSRVGTDGSIRDSSPALRFPESKSRLSRSNSDLISEAC